MRLTVFVLLAATACGFPDRWENSGGQETQIAKDVRVRETQRDCKGKCATSIAQKAAAEAKAAQAAQNAAGAQAAHMVSFDFMIRISQYEISYHLKLHPKLNKI